MEALSPEHKKRLEKYRDSIEKELELALYGVDTKVGEAMRYSVLGGGKRIRGVLTLEFCRMFGGDTSKAVYAAAAIEMIHAFSLIHDDLPCMDDDDFRRGKPSCHKQFDEATALLAGDALLALALNTAAFPGIMPKGLKPQNVVSVISVLSNAVKDMITGQQEDIDFEKKKVSKISEEDLLAMYSRKTSALISAACVCGASCANSVNEKNMNKSRYYGFTLGLAFQFTDDLLDFSTEKKDKKTFPVLFGEKKAKEKAWEYTDMAIKAAESFPDGDFLKDLAITLNSRRI